MIFSGTPFEISKYGGKKIILTNICNYLTSSDEEIFVKKKKIIIIIIIKDLGIKINDKPDFTDHVNFVITKGKQKADWILRSFRRRNPEFMKHM